MLEAAALPSKALLLYLCLILNTALNLVKTGMDRPCWKQPLLILPLSLLGLIL